MATPIISSALISATQGSGSGSSSVSRRRVDAGPFSVEIAPPSHNAHLMRISNVIWTEAFSYLSFKELYFGVVQACKYMRQRSAEALVLILSAQHMEVQILSVEEESIIFGAFLQHSQR